MDPAELVALFEATAARHPPTPGGCRLNVFWLPRQDALGDKLPLAVNCKPTKDDFPVYADAGIVPVWLPGTKCHRHGLLGVGRSLGELDIVRLITERAETLGRKVRVADVGSNPERLRAALLGLRADVVVDHVHHIIPVLQPGDGKRLINARRFYPHCTCRWQDCTHVRDFDVYLFQHSLYYFTPNELADHLPPHAVAYATLHHIDAAAGDLYHQLTWFVGDDGLAECLAAGNPLPYRHLPNAWVTDHSHPAHTYLDLHHESEWFGTHVYTITRLGEPVEFDWRNSADARDWAGRINGVQPYSVSRALGPAALAGGGEVFVERLEAVRHIGASVFAVEVGGRVTAMPADLVGALATRAAGQPRTPSLTRSLYEYGRRLLQRGGFPPDRVPRVLLVGVCAALTRDLAHETATLGRLHATHQNLFATHARVLEGGAVSRWRWYNWLDPRNWFYRCTADEHETDEAQFFAHSRDAGYGVAPARPVDLAGRNFQPIYEAKTDPLPSQAEGAFFRVLSEPDRVAPQPSVHCALIALGPLVPTTARNDPDAAKRAFAVRLGRLTPPASPGVWEGLYQRVRSRTSVLRWLSLPPINPSRDTKLRWVTRFPAHERVKFLRAMEDLEVRPLEARDCVGSAMVKVEKSGLVGPDGPPRVDERLVVSYRPERQVATGPIDWVAANHWRAAFSPSDPTRPAVWVNGRDATAEAFGAWFDVQVAAIRAASGSVWYMWGDQSKFEAHRDPGAWTYARRIMFDAVTDEDYRFAREQSICIRGRTQRFDALYQARHVLGSGGTETSADSFLRNISSLVWVFGEPSLGKLALAANGDDWLVIADRPMAVEEFHELMLECGFESDFACSQEIERVEFCQALPWPVNGGTVWGPKIGRVLSRLPWATTSQRDDPRGVAIGMLVAVSHIPFLRRYVQRVLQLSPHQPAVAYEHRLAASRPHAAAEDTFEFLQARYGLTRVDEDRFVELLLTTTLGTVVDWPPLAEAACADE